MGDVGSARTWFAQRVKQYELVRMHPLEDEAAIFFTALAHPKVERYSYACFQACPRSFPLWIGASQAFTPECHTPFLKRNRKGEPRRDAQPLHFNRLPATSCMVVGPPAGTNLVSPRHDILHGTTLDWNLGLWHVCDMHRSSLDIWSLPPPTVDPQDSRMEHQGTTETRGTSLHVVLHTQWMLMMCCHVAQ